MATKKKRYQFLYKMAKWNESKEPFFCQYRNCKEKILFSIWPHLEKDPRWCFLHYGRFNRWFIYSPWGALKFLGAIYGSLFFFLLCYSYFLGWPA